MRLFIYGSLRRGESHAHLMAETRFLGSARTERGYALIDLGAYPALVAEGSSSVHGELYEIDESMLPGLDAYEDAPDLYLRVTVRLADGSAAETYVWNGPDLGDRPRVESGDWRRRQ